MIKVVQLQHPRESAEERYPTKQYVLAKILRICKLITSKSFDKIPIILISI